MTIESFNESVNADIRRMTNKARLCEKCGEPVSDERFYFAYPGTTKIEHWNCKAQQGEPTSFSAWLEANQDSIEPLDRTEATAQWFDEKEARNE